MEKKKIILLVGAGAIENAWTPVVDAIKEINKNISANNANAFFAKLIHLARCYSQIEHPQAKQDLKLTLSNIDFLKNLICQKLRSAQEQSKINARPEFQKIIRKFITVSNNETYLVSTNWDTVIENEINRICHLEDKTNKIPCLYIHGNIDSDIYLPTEMTQENYRNKEQEIFFGKKHSSFITILEKTNTLIIYGLSMSPLDAELLQTVGLVCYNINEIIIIDLNPDIAADNIKAIIDPEVNLKITGYSPFNLDIGCPYSSIYIN
ncbi:hypothetical protein DVK85_02150 [Flavobacterium arcticum]|uniref:SIR2-like domain-containing protein n=1 Tax=Flavobacterium arcticum TaxID=1784713 RepID=A0A345H932_9FLAO|nr:hypothetical protein [Flavobacterium arcticum]AXG73092.1 hypothetical protein DVK85_02150 [Flavobacterium arcticum]KAF2512883.1 hypothetical protein E0W72_00220 [Flavobacterium arcticum]